MIKYIGKVCWTENKVVVKYKGKAQYILPMWFGFFPSDSFAAYFYKICQGNLNSR